MVDAVTQELIEITECLESDLKAYRTCRDFLWKEINYYLETNFDKTDIVEEYIEAIKSTINWLDLHYMPHDILLAKLLKKESRKEEEPVFTAATRGTYVMTNKVGQSRIVYLSEGEILDPNAEYSKVD
jgi:hypothetical protein